MRDLPDLTLLAPAQITNRYPGRYGYVRIWVC
jgi:hypothetical protein